jgi:hypothetical protein
LVMKGTDRIQRPFNDVKSAAGPVIEQDVARASVAVPFIIALGCATAGVTLLLARRFGHSNAYFIVAAGLTALGLLAGLIVRTKEHDETALGILFWPKSTNKTTADDDAVGSGILRPNSGHRSSGLHEAPPPQNISATNALASA